MPPEKAAEKASEPRGRPPARIVDRSTLGQPVENLGDALLQEPRHLFILFLTTPERIGDGRSMPDVIGWQVISHQGRVQLSPVLRPQGQQMPGRHGKDQIHAHQRVRM